MKKITILLVDDHRMVRDMWAFILNSDERFRVVSSAGSDDDVTRLTRRLWPDIVLMDIAMTPVDGFELTEKICALKDAPKVIGVSMYSMPAYAKKMLQAGAKGYLTKNSSKEELIYAILEVSSGKRYICEEIRNYLAADQLAPANIKTKIIDLTDRELQVLALIKQGLSSREIGDRLEVGRKTVDAHRYNILKKLNLRNTAALVNYANLNGL